MFHYSIKRSCRFPVVEALHATEPVPGENSVLLVVQRLAVGRRGEKPPRRSVAHDHPTPNKRPGEVLATYMYMLAEAPAPDTSVSAAILIGTG